MLDKLGGYILEPRGTVTIKVCFYHRLMLFYRFSFFCNKLLLFTAFGFCLTVVIFQSHSTFGCFQKLNFFSELLEQ